MASCGCDVTLTCERGLEAGVEAEDAHGVEDVEADSAPPSLKLLQTGERIKYNVLAVVYGV